MEATDAHARGARGAAGERAAQPEAWRRQVRAYEPVEREFDDVPLRVAEGALPGDLRGVLYRNGPGRLERGGLEYGHLFDGDGMVTRFEFGADGVRYRNRYVRTRAFCDEEVAGRVLYRNFGTNRPGGLAANLLRMRFKNAANTSVLLHGGALLALWEGGMPYRLDPRTLATLGKHDFDGQLRTRGAWIDRKIAPEMPFSAHPRRDPETGEVFNFGTVMGRAATLALYRIDPDGRMDPPATLPMDAAFFAHDFVLTANWRAFLLSPVAFRAARTLLGLDTPVGSIEGRDGPARWLLVPRRGGAPVVVRAPRGFVFHHANGFEDERGALVVDVVRFGRYPELGSLSDMRRGRFAPPSGDGPRLLRCTVDPYAGTVTERAFGEHPLELPTVNPRHVGRRHRYVYAVGTEPGRGEPFFTGVVRADAETGAVQVRDFGLELPGEPLFVPRPGGAREDDGWILVLSYVPDAHRSDLRVLDATDLSTVCRLELPHHVPPGFHGVFAPA